MAILLVAWGCCAWRWLDTPLRELTCGAATGLLLFTSPGCGVLGALLLMTAMLGSREPLGRPFPAALVGAVVGAGAAVWAFPYPIFDWVEGVRAHSRLYLGLPVGRGFRDTWITRPELPLLALSFGLLGAAAARRLVDIGHGLQGGRRLGFGLALLIFVAGLIRIAFLKTEASYNAVVWMPAFACLGLSGPGSGVRSWAVIAGLALPVLGVSRSAVIVMEQYRPPSVGFAEVRERIRELGPGDCTITSGLWMAVDDLSKVRVAARGERATRRFFVLQQTYTGRREPPDISGYKLVENRFGPPVQLFGIPISRTPGGWEFAVYERRDR